MPGMGFISGSDMGINFASSLDLSYRDNDLPSRCDQVLFGADADTGSACPSGDSISSSFSGANGIMAGMFAGYKYHEFRLELEYLYRNSNYNEESTVQGANGQSLEKLTGEISRAVQEINQARSNNFFANVYYDIPIKSRFAPYLGAGVGVSMTDFGYSLTFTRNTDPNEISASSVPDGTLEQRSTLAGTSSTLDTTFSDTIFTFQVLGGVDYWLSNNLALGVKGRWVWFDSFSDSATLDQLRSHEPNNGPGTETVVANVDIDSFHMYGATLSLKYMFGD